MISCRRCLLEDIHEDQLLETIRDMIQSLPQDLKVSEVSYRSRLSLCRACDHLLSGMCLKCGCYVELRCAYLNRHCPDIPSQW